MYVCGEKKKKRKREGNRNKIKQINSNYNTIKIKARRETNRNKRWVHENHYPINTKQNTNDWIHKLEELHHQTCRSNF